MVTAGSIALIAMEPRDWTDLKEPHERLTWARARWQLAKNIKPSGKAAAESVGLKEHTYTAYERPPGSSKHTPLSHQRAILFARKFGVSWQWLLTGRGEPDNLELSDDEWQLVAALRDAPEERQKDMVAAIVRLLKSA